MAKPIFETVPGTYDDLVNIINGDTVIQVQNSAIVDQAVKFLCKCRPEVRAKVIAELANPNQWAVSHPITDLCRDILEGRIAFKDVGLHQGACPANHEDGRCICAIGLQRAKV